LQAGQLRAGENPVRHLPRTDHDGDIVRNIRDHYQWIGHSQHRAIRAGTKKSMKRRNSITGHRAGHRGTGFTAMLRTSLAAPDATHRQPEQAVRIFDV